MSNKIKMAVDNNGEYELIEFTENELREQITKDLSELCDKYVGKIATEEDVLVDLSDDLQEYIRSKRSRVVIKKYIQGDGEVNEYG